MFKILKIPFLLSAYTKNLGKMVIYKFDNKKIKMLKNAIAYQLRNMSHKNQNLMLNKNKF